MQSKYESDEIKKVMIIDNSLLDQLSRKASDNDRLRKNFNLHVSHNDSVQRLLNAMEPGTIMPVHRHSDTDETYILLRGKLEVLLYNDRKELIEKILLSQPDGKFGIHILKGQWHGLNVLESGTIIFEVKEGPYKPIEKKDVLEV